MGSGAAGATTLLGSPGEASRAKSIRGGGSLPLPGRLRVPGMSPGLRAASVPDGECKLGSDDASSRWGTGGVRVPSGYQDTRDTGQGSQPAWPQGTGALGSALGRAAPGPRGAPRQEALSAAGDPKVPVLYEVDRTRTGRSFSVRSVKAIQHGKPILTCQASFQLEQESPMRHQFTMPAVPPPEELLTQEELISTFLQNPNLAERYRKRLNRIEAKDVPIDIKPVNPPSMLCSAGNAARPWGEVPGPGLAWRVGTWTRTRCSGINVY
ncbi:PREDICTED: acyl-coenzyme A thioesterase 8 [Tinamus guttatus]|uniref:acyl-coenzyme A thioesterase 8 n=1 Tax=Tinamus guttatus TaxID=94827 RepID=UPI00052F1877|nr:PREDICTED: acyl-coenzyme A thioesterase 8 [Tinamus guttatus]